MVIVADTTSLEATLQRRRQLRRLLAVSGIFCGVPLSLISPLVLGTIFWIVSGMLFEAWYAWFWFFLGLALLTLPLLFRLEQKSQGDYLGKTLMDSGPPIPGSGELTMMAHLAVGPLAGLGAATATNPRMASAGFVEIFLTGPRMVLKGVRHLRQERTIGEVDYRLAAGIVARLLSQDEGLRLEQLPRDGANKDGLLSALQWLAFYGWLGISETQDRVYLYSESRAEFARD